MALQNQASNLGIVGAENCCRFLTFLAIIPEIMAVSIESELESGCSESVLKQ